MGVCSSKSSFDDIPFEPSKKYNKYVPEITTGRVIKVYDGDTITIAGRVKYNPNIYKFSVRLNGLDCPEMKTKDKNEKEIALKAKEFVSSLVLNKIITLKNVDLDKYGRLLAHVYINNTCVNTELINKNLAVKYDGGTKHVPDNWSEYWKIVN